MIRKDMPVGLFLSMLLFGMLAAPFQWIYNKIIRGLGYKPVIVKERFLLYQDAINLTTLLTDGIAFALYESRKELRIREKNETEYIVEEGRRIRVIRKDDPRILKQFGQAKVVYTRY